MPEESVNPILLKKSLVTIASLLEKNELAAESVIEKLETYLDTPDRLRDDKLLQLVAQETRISCTLLIQIRCVLYSLCLKKTMQTFL